MGYQGIQGIAGSTTNPSSLPGAAKDSSGEGFGALFRRLAEDANRAQMESDRLVESLAKGEPTDVHEVMLALTEADLSFRMLVEVRNRIVEAYQEIQRMPV